jgi:hypothetical protein
MFDTGTTNVVVDGNLDDALDGHDGHGAHIIPWFKIVGY